MEKQTTTTTEQEQVQGQPPAEAQNTDTPGPVPYERFKEVNAELAALRKWRAEQEAAAQKAAREAEEAEQRRLEEQKEFRRLAEERKAKLAEIEATATEQARRIEVLESALETYAATAREGLPQPVLDLLSELDVVAQLEWLAKNREALLARPPVGVPATPRAQGVSQAMTDEERRKRAYKSRL